MYRALQLEFQSDKVAKMKSDQVDLPKGRWQKRKRKRKKRIYFLNRIRKQLSKKKNRLWRKRSACCQSSRNQRKKNVVKIEAPEYCHPKVITKIDLSTIDSSTRPKKTAKKKADQEAELPPVEEKSEEIRKGSQTTRRKQKSNRQKK